MKSCKTEGQSTVNRKNNTRAIAIYGKGHYSSKEEYAAPREKGLNDSKETIKKGRNEEGEKLQSYQRMKG